MEAADEIENPLRPQEATPQFTAGRVNMAPRNEHPLLDDPLRLTRMALAGGGGALPFALRAGTTAYSTITSPPPIIKDAVEKMFDSAPARSIAARLRNATAQPLGVGPGQPNLGIGTRVGQWKPPSELIQNAQAAGKALGDASRFATKNHLRDKWLELHGQDGKKAAGYAIADVLY
jgi:hypothetical protein